MTFTAHYFHLGYQQQLEKDAGIKDTLKAMGLAGYVGLAGGMGTGHFLGAPAIKKLVKMQTEHIAKASKTKRMDDLYKKFSGRYGKIDRQAMENSYRDYISSIPPLEIHRYKEKALEELLPMQQKIIDQARFAITQGNPLTIEKGITDKMRRAVHEQAVSSQFPNSYMSRSRDVAAPFLNTRYKEISYPGTAPLATQAKLEKLRKQHDNAGPSATATGGITGLAMGLLAGLKASRAKKVKT